MVRARENENLEDAYQRSVRENLQHINLLMEIFLPADVIDNFEAPDEMAYMEKAKKLLDPVLHTKKVNLKLIYDRELQFSEFPRYATQYCSETKERTSYIELHEKEKEPKIFYTKWEKDNRIERGNTPSVMDSNDSILDDLDNIL